MKTDLNEINRKARQVYQEDGLTMLFAGVALAIFAGFFIDIRHGWVFAFGIIMFMLMTELLRRRFVYPRVGYAQFPRLKDPISHVITVFLVSICLALFYVFGKLARFNWLMPVYLGTVFSVAALIMARKFGLVIYYVLTFVFLLSGITGTFFTMREYAAGWVVAFQLWALAVFLVTIGVFQFASFLHKHSEPKSGQEVLDDQ